MGKTCSKCSRSDVEFEPRKKAPDGLRSQCRGCRKELRRDYYVANKDEVLKKNKRWVEKNPERIKKIKKRSHKKNGRKLKLWRAYKMTVEDYNAMLSKQGGRCAVPECRTDTPGGVGSFKVDHDHKTGRVRALLCNWCNTALGQALDSPIRLRALAAYLESFESAPQS
jgi:hypothetical protein